MEERDNSLPINYFVAIKTKVNFFPRQFYRLLCKTRSEQPILNTRNSRTEKKINFKEIFNSYETYLEVNSLLLMLSFRTKLHREMLGIHCRGQT